MTMTPDGWPLSQWPPRLRLQAGRSVPGRDADACRWTKLFPITENYSRTIRRTPLH